MPEAAVEAAAPVAMPAAGAASEATGLLLTLGDALRMAVGTLTAVPVPAPRRIDRRVGGTAMVLAPLAGLIPGLAAAAVAWACLALRASPLLSAVLALGLVALATRGLHLDGLADTADGLTAAYDRERALQVMRRGNTGPAGAATLVFVLVVQVAALAQALDRFGPVAALIGVLAGRAALTLACTRGIPAARPEGLGATVAGSVPRTAVVLVMLVVAASAAGVARDPAAAAAPLPGAAVAGVLLRRATTRLGGVTGDVLGACIEAATAAALVTLAVLP
jgi:adenosylcobinamide-GDP ribazoletransferase